MRDIPKGRHLYTGRLCGFRFNHDKKSNSYVYSVLLRDVKSIDGLFNFEHLWVISQELYFKFKAEVYISFTATKFVYNRANDSKDATLGEIRDIKFPGEILKC